MAEQAKGKTKPRSIKFEPIKVAETKPTPPKVKRLITFEGAKGFMRNLAHTMKVKHNAVKKSETDF